VACSRLRQRGVLPGVLPLAGLFPACYKHLSLFFSDRELSLAYAIMLTALRCSQIVGGPLAGGLQYINARGLYGFQWLFIVEGVITVIWGCCIWVSLLHILLADHEPHGSFALHYAAAEPGRKK